MRISRSKIIPVLVSLSLALAVLVYIHREAEIKSNKVTIGELGKINLLLKNQLHVPLSFWGSSTTLVHVSPKVNRFHNGFRSIQLWT